MPGDGGDSRWTASYLLFVLAGLVAYSVWQWRYSGRVQTVIQADVALSILLLSLILGRSFYWKVHDVVRMTEGEVYHVMYERPELTELYQRNRQELPYRVASVGITPAYAWAYGFETVDGTANMYPQRYKDFWSQVIEHSMSQDRSIEAHFEGWGNRVYLFLPAKRPSANKDLEFAEYFNLQLLSLANARYVISDIPVKDPHLTALPFGRQNQTTQPNLSLPEKVLRVLRAETNRFYIYENDAVLPRFFWQIEFKYLQIGISYFRL